MKYLLCLLLSAGCSLLIRQKLSEDLCGDGELSGVEQCDDGNVTDFDGCQSNCSLRVPFCGDGFLDQVEECDDGNNLPGDGCDEGCLSEPRASCGNQTAEPGEFCDFGSPVEIGGELAPSAVIAADINGDQLPDVAFVDEVSNTLTVLLGDGAGDFDDGQTIASGGLVPHFLLAAPLDPDANNDPSLELVVTHLNDGAVQVFRFEPAVGLTPNGLPEIVGSSLERAAVGFFNEDSALDLAVADPFNDIADILFNTNGGLLSFAGGFPTQVNDERAVTSADFNGDGLGDLAVVGDDPNIGILLAGPDSFEQLGAFEVLEGGSNSVLSHDLDQDGFTDIIAIDNAGAVRVLLGTGDCAQLESCFRRIDPFLLNTQLLSGAVGDLDRDGFLDLAMVSQNGAIAILLGRGDGTFREKLERNFLSGSGSESIDVADFNQDGVLDLVTTNANQGSVTVLFGLQ